MNYYKRHIGDYAKKTRRLNMLQHGAYTLLLDACYDRERFPKSVEEAIDWAWAQSAEEIEAVKFVLSRLFVAENGFYVELSCAEAFGDYVEKAQTNARIAQEREEKRRKLARTVHEASPSVHEASPSVHEASPNHKPLTNNQEPIKQEHCAPEIPTSEIQPENIKAVLAMKDAGIFSTTPNNPELLAALAEGVTPELLGEVASKNPGKPQLYVVRTAVGQLRDSKKNGAQFSAKAAIRAPPALPTEEEHRAAARPLPDWVLEIQNSEEGEADVANI